HRLLLALMDQAELDGNAGRHRTDTAREFARVMDIIAVDRGDDVAALDARLGRRTAGLRLGNQRAGRLLQTHAVGDIRRDRLDLHADPAARHRALVAKL